MSESNGHPSHDQDDLVQGWLTGPATTATEPQTSDFETYDSSEEQATEAFPASDPEMYAAHSDRYDSAIEDHPDWASDGHPEAGAGMAAGRSFRSAGVRSGPPRSGPQKKPRKTPFKWSALPKKKRQAWLIVGSVIIAAVVLLGLIIGLSGGSTSSDKKAGPVSIDQPQAPAMAEANADCPTSSTGAVTTGRDAGGTTSGPNVIKAFDHAYYVDRSGAKARQFVSPTGQVGSAEQLQAAIERLDSATLHCLKITDRGNNLYGVELTQLPPLGEQPTVYRQVVQTTGSDRSGQVLILSIKKDN